MNLDERRFQIGLTVGIALITTGVGLLVGGLIEAGAAASVVGLFVFVWGIYPSIKVWRKKSTHEIEEPGQMAGTPRSSDRGGAHRDIDEAAQYLKKGQPKVAIEQLERIKRRYWDQLSSRERYRVLANIGNAELLQDQKERAARLYLQAAEYQPTDEEARAYKALAYHLADDQEKAHELAVALCSDHPGLGRAHMIRIRTTPDEISLDEILASVPSAARGHPEVILALHDRARAEERLDDAERILREHPQEDQTWPHLNLALANTILQQEAATLRVTFEGPVESDRARLSEAESLFDSVLEIIPEGDPENLSFGVYSNRGTCRRLVGDHEGAREDFTKARDLKPSDEQTSIALARTAYPYRNDLNEAIRVLEEYLKENASALAKLLLGEFFRIREGTGDLERAAQILEKLVPELSRLEEEEERADLVAALADVYLRTSRSELAVGLIQGLPEQSLKAATWHAILGDVFNRIGRREDSLTQAELAEDALANTDKWADVRRVALLFEGLGRYRRAFELWRRVLPPHFVSRETDHLLRCARKSGEDQFVLNFCQDLRSNGHFDRRSLGHEIETLLDYSEFKKAREAFSQYLEAKPDDKIVRLHLTVLAKKQGWEELVADDLSQLPSVDELNDAEIGGEVVNVLRFGSSPIQAVEYAYELYRRFPDHPAAHRALIVAVLAPGPTGLSIEKPDTVAEGTAVAYLETGDEEIKWLVIEDGDDPSLSRSEYPSSHRLPSAMLGKKPGEAFRLYEGGVRDRSAVIKEVLDKRVYRANDMMMQWTERFPDQPFVESIPLGKGDEPFTHDFTEFIEITKRLSEQKDRIEAAYVDGNIPVSSLAHFMSRTVFETMGYLAANPELSIRSCGGSIQEIEEATGLLTGAESTVLDPSAIATLAILEEVDLVRDLGIRCVVTESTLQEIRDLLSQKTLNPKPTGYLGYKEGKLWLQETDETTEAQRLDALNSLLKTLETECEVIGGSDLAQLESTKRRQLAEILAPSSAETTAAASQRGLILWTDDHLGYELLKSDLGSSRIWTQAVFIWAHGEGVLDRKRRSRATARLLAAGYAFTSSSAEVVLDICEDALWNPEKPELSAVLSDFGNPAWNTETTIQMSAETLRRIWREAPTEEHASRVTARLLVQLADRADHATIVRSLLRNANSLLGLALTRSESLRQILNTHLRGGGTILR